MTRLSGLALIVPPVAMLLFFFVAPLAYLLFVSFHAHSDSALYAPQLTFENYTVLLRDSFYPEMVARTLRTTTIVLAFTLVIGYAAAFALVRLTTRVRMFVLVALLFPLMVTSVVRAYGWIMLLGRNGAVNTTLQSAGVIDQPLTLLYTADTVIFGLVTVLLPFMIISVTNALAAIDRSYDEAAASLGAGPLRRFVSVTLPLSTPGIAAGLQLVFLLSLSAYVTITLLGGPRQKLLVSFVYDSVTAFQWPRAAALSFVLLAIALIGAGIIQTVLRPQRVMGRGK